jgi:hypothetical protein
LNQYKSILCLLFVMANSIYESTAQDTLSSCNCGGTEYNAPIGVMFAYGHLKDEWMVSYRYMNMMMYGNLMNSNKVSNELIYQNYLMAPDKMNMQMHMIMVMYGLSDKITLMGMINYTSNSMKMSMMHGNSHMGNMNMPNAEMDAYSRNYGFGDSKIYGMYNFLNNNDHQVLLNLGISIPTGSISHKGNGMNEEQKYSYSLQTGTGVFSVLPGITYTGNRSSYSWGTQFTSDIKTGKNAAGYKIGNEFILTGWLTRNWNDWLSNSIRVSGKTTGRIHGYDREIAVYRTVEPDADVNNSGGENMNAFAGINFLIPQGFLRGNRIGVEYGFPIYQCVNGIQMKSRAMINAGWEYSF